MNTTASLTLAALLLAPPTALHAAELKLAAVFSDHMVLQCGKAVPVWGWADPGGKITVEFAGQAKAVTADSAGKWQVKLDPMPASAEPRTMVVKSTIGNSQSTISDVLVGEVWLGSGQSNMGVSVGGSRDFEKEAAAANLPLIRMFREDSKTAETPQANATGTWVVCSPQTVAGFSAVLYFFGRELRRELKVPVGLINSSLGDTAIQSWIAADVQAKIPELKAGLDADVKADAAIDWAGATARYEKTLASWKEKAAQAKAAGQRPANPPCDPLEVRNRRGSLRGGGLFNGKIAPLIPLAIRGMVWYQGESNTRPAEAGRRYSLQLPLLITDWRTRWGEELPFASVQLANYIPWPPGNYPGWPLVREAQLKSLRLPHTGMAVAIDIGEADNIHPKNKQDVGKRLALWALGDVYGKKVPATSGPLPAGHEVSGSNLIVTFTHADGGLLAKEGDLKGLVIAGADQQWKPAQARIEGDKVIVSSPDVPQPVAVRYAWSENPDCNLYNGAGLPAAPFRTDAWPVPSADGAKNIK